MIYWGIFRREFRNRKNVGDEIQMIISLIKDELQTSTEKVISQNKNNERLLWSKSDGIKHCWQLILFKNLIEKGTQHQKIYHICLTIKFFCVVMYNFIH